MAKKCKIFETMNKVSNLKIGENSEGLIQLTGVFGVCGTRNNNNRIYEHTNYKAMVDIMKNKILTEGCPGELEHPNNMNITLENVSHKIDDINIDESGTVTGTITLLNTPKGQIAQSIVEGGLPLFISSRANGSINDKGVVTLEELKTYDLVGSPGFSQARLSVKEGAICESLSDDCYIIIEGEEKENSKSYMNTNKTIEERLSEMESSLNMLVRENEELKIQLDESQDIKNWVINEYSDQLQNYFETVLIPEARKGIKNESIKDYINIIAESTQNWVINEYSPEVEKWVNNNIQEYLNKGTKSNFNVESLAEGIQNWVINEYSPEIQNWVVEEFAPKIQNWIINEYSPEIQNWVVEEYSPEVEKWMLEEYTPEYGTTKKNALSNIQETLKVLESYTAPKQNISRKAMITEGKDYEGYPTFIKEMPDQFRPLWECASQEVRESINRKSKLFNFANSGSIQRFWESIDFNPVSVSPEETKYTNINESRIMQSLRRGY